MQKGELFEVEFIVNSLVYDGFINTFKDKNPLHTQQDFAIRSGFESVVMHGNILGGFLSYFIGECLPIKNVIIHSQEIKYVKPVYLDDALILKATIVDIFESVGVVEFKFIFEKKEGNIIVAKGKISIGIL